MGYRIDYGGKKRKNVVKILLPCLFLAVTVCCVNNESFAEALENMVLMLQNGENAAQAVAQFCRDMIYGT